MPCCPFNLRKYTLKATCVNQSYYGRAVPVPFLPSGDRTQWAAVPLSQRSGWRSTRRPWTDGTWCEKTLAQSCYLGLETINKPQWHKEGRLQTVVEVRGRLIKSEIRLISLEIKAKMTPGGLIWKYISLGTMVAKDNINYANMMGDYQ